MYSKESNTASKKKSDILYIKQGQIVEIGSTEKYIYWLLRQFERISMEKGEV